MGGLPGPTRGRGRTGMTGARRWAPLLLCLLQSAPGKGGGRRGGRGAAGALLQTDPGREWPGRGLCGVTRVVRIRRYHSPLSPNPPPAVFFSPGTEQTRV